MGFCPSGVLSQYGFVQLGFVLVGFCPSGVLSYTPKGGPTLNLALIGPAVSEKNMFEHVERRTVGIL